MRHWHRPEHYDVSANWNDLWWSDESSTWAPASVHAGAGRSFSSVRTVRRRVDAIAVANEINSLGSDAMTTHFFWAKGIACSNVFVTKSADKSVDIVDMYRLTDWCISQMKNRRSGKPLWPAAHE